MTRKEFNNGVNSIVNVAVQRANEFLEQLDLSLSINWEYDSWGYNDLNNAIGVYENGSVFGGDISIGFNMANLYKSFTSQVKEYPWTDKYTILDEIIQTNVFHEMGHGIVDLLNDYLQETDDLDELYDSSQELFDNVLDNEEDSVEEFAWAMYDNDLEKSKLYKLVILYLNLYSENNMTENVNKRKIYINSKQYGMLKESEWNFHFGKEHNGKPYYSDSKYQMAGRETGHFGSGTYFSTYRDIKGIDNYGDFSRNQNPNFIEIKDHLYRVDFGLYKNLYRVRSKKQGDVLYTMMANLNRMANKIAYMGHFQSKAANYANSHLYQKIKSNADGLGLKCPSYYELTRMAQKLGQDENDIRSFSTVFMEWNGYNGVNVSGIDGYDNTKHGSVIYDLSKVNTDMEEVSPKNLFTGFDYSSYDNTIVQDFSDDPRIESLKGKYANWYDKLNEMPLSDALRVLKNYTDSGNLLGYFKVKNLNPELIKRYLRFIFVKNPRNSWGDSLVDEEIVSGKHSDYFAELIDEYEAYYWVNYESKKGSVLVNLLNNFSKNLDWNLTTEEENVKKEEYLSKLMNYMQRDLTPWEKEFIDGDYYYDGD